MGTHMPMPGSEEHFTYSMPEPHRETLWLKGQALYLVLALSQAIRQKSSNLNYYPSSAKVKQKRKSQAHMLNSSLGNLPTTQLSQQSKKTAD